MLSRVLMGRLAVDLLDAMNTGHPGYGQGL
jgi:Flp pilus assembly CpaF family ATPase